MKWIAPLACAALLAGCTIVPRPSDIPVATAPAPPVTEPGFARLGETADLGSLTVRPDSLVEDSRCPMNARCVWAGRLIVAVTVIDHGTSTHQQLTLGEPLALAGGQLVLDSAEPGKLAERPTTPGDYRFHFDFRK